MRKKFCHPVFLLSIVLALAASVSAAGDQSAAGVVEIGRPLKARAWLADLGDIPTATVPYTSLPVSQLIPGQGANYRIDPDVAVVAYTYFFNVQGRDSRYVVGSAVNLAKLVHELAVIDELKKRSMGKEFASGVADGVKGIGTGLANLITSPGQSIKGVGKRLRQTGRSLERAVGAEDKIGRDESGRDRSHLGSGPAGKIRREFAYQFGVDVYTANPDLQKVLTELSHANAAGGLTTFVIPYNIGMLDYFNPIAGDDITETRIRDYDPYELRRLVGEELGPVLRMDREDAYQPLNRWLVNPNYSPRNIAYIGQALMQLKGAGNLPLVVQELGQAETPEEADTLTLELRLYGLLDQNVQKVVDFAKYRALFVGLGADQVMYIMFPGDTLRPWEETIQAFNEVVTDAATMGLKGVEIWSVGDVHPAMLENAKKFGVAIRTNVLRDERFYHPMPARTAAQ